MFRWIGLALALIGAIVAVMAGFGSHWEVALIFALIFVIGLFVLSRPNL